MTNERHIFQTRDDQGWHTIRGYRGPQGAMNAIRNVNETDRSPYRVIVGDPRGSFRTIAARN